MMQEGKNLPTKLITLQTLCSLDSHEDMSTGGQDVLHNAAAALPQQPQDQQGQ